MAYHSVPTPPAALQSRGYGNASGVDDFAPTPAHPIESLPLSQSLHQDNALGDIAVGGYSGMDAVANNRGSTVMGLERHGLQRTTSFSSSSGGVGSGGIGGGVSRGNTLTKKGSFKRKSSLRRSGSRRSMYAGSLKGLSLEGERVSARDANSVFHTPVPTSGNPTDILAARFQAWRKFLKDLITYFREVQASYDGRYKALLKVANVASITNVPPLFLTTGGINDANAILRDFHKHTLADASKSRDIQNDVITQLSGLRADLAAKIKEIKGLSGDFKNSVEKEMAHTRRSVAHLEEALAVVDADPSNTIARDDPFVIRLGVDRQVEKQIDEENYLHNAYLNLERSGRELESIVVGEVQKAYNALASILKREADENYDTIERLRSGPISMPRDKEWARFVEADPNFVTPDIPVRRVEEIEYPGKHHPAAQEVRAGMLERKSKYLKSYTPGWYVLSPTHLHEFKSADRIYSQPPVMSLFLPDQKLGSHSQPTSSSHKFILKGRQTGALHRGHSWVFRAETYDTMLAWFDAMRALTNSSSAERDAYVRKHSRSVSQTSQYGESASGGSELDEDEADEVPYSANASSLNAIAMAIAGQGVNQHDSRNGGVGQVKEMVIIEQRPTRPQPGGRFPSEPDMAMPNRDLRIPASPSSGTHSSHEFDAGVSGAANQHEQQGSSQTEHVSMMAGGLGAGTVASRGMNGAEPQAPLVQHASSHQVNRVDDSLARTQPSRLTEPLAAEQQDPQHQIDGANFDAYNHDSSSHGNNAPPLTSGVAALGSTEEYWRRQRIEAEQQALQQQSVTAAPIPPRAEGNSVPTALAMPIPPLTPETCDSTPSTPAFASPTLISSIESTAPMTLSELSSVPDAIVDDLKSSSGVEVGAFGTEYDTNSDGTSNAKVTGPFVPILRHNTDVSVAELHVPGEYPLGLKAL